MGREVGRCARMDGSHFTAHLFILSQVSNPVNISSVEMAFSITLMIRDLCAILEALFHIQG